MKGLKYVLAGALVAALPLVASSARARKPTRFVSHSNSPSPYLHLNVMKTPASWWKSTPLLGVPDVKVTFAQFSGGDAMNDALISGAIDIVCGGAPAMLYLVGQDKGHAAGSARRLRARLFRAAARTPATPNIKSIEDFRDTDKIAVPGVKVSGQAIIPEMAAAGGMGYGELGEARQADTSRSRRPIRLPACWPTTPRSNPHSRRRLSPNCSSRTRTCATILKSRDIVGNATSSVWWTSKRFHDNNPKVYQAIINATKEAQAFIDKDLPHRGEVLHRGLRRQEHRRRDRHHAAQAQGNGYRMSRPTGFMIYADFLEQGRAVSRTSRPRGKTCSGPRSTISRATDRLM